MNVKTKHRIFKLSLSSVIISMTVLLNIVLMSSTTTQAAYTERLIVNNDTFLTPKINISVCADGINKIYFAPIGTVENALKYLKISLNSDDIINAKLSNMIYPGEQIKIDRVNYAYYTEHRNINYKTIEKDSSELFVGQTKIQNGKYGIKKYTYKDKYVNGKVASHNCIKQQVLTYPQDEIVIKGTKKIDVINDSFNSRTDVLIKTDKDDKNFKLPCVKLSDKDRDMLERIVTGEFGSSYVGSCLIAQSIKCAIIYDGYKSISDVIKGMGYVGSTKYRSQNAVNAVKYIFDDNNLAVKHRLFYMCTEDYYDSTPGNFHSTQNFVLQYKNVLFYDRW